MAANRQKSQPPYTDALQARLQPAKPENASREDRLAALSDNQRSLLADLIERISKFVQMFFESLGGVADSYFEIVRKLLRALIQN